MIAGLNSNIKYDGRMFHVQTEDSGPRYGHVISHLFLDGVILATRKTEYPEVGDDGEADEKAIAESMRKSHREMIRKLTSGSYDAELDDGDTVDSDASSQPSPSSVFSEEVAKESDSVDASVFDPIEPTPPEEPPVLIEKEEEQLPEPAEVAQRIDCLLSEAPETNPLPAKIRKLLDGADGA